MPTKKELLEEKTVKELKDMARDKDLSGYSRLPKDELIEMISKNYLKKEIKTWPETEEKEEGIEKPEEAEVVEEKTVEEGPAEEVETGIREVKTENVETEEIDPSQVVDVERDVDKAPKPTPGRKPEEEAETFKNIIIGVIIGIAILVAILVLYFVM